MRKVTVVMTRSDNGKDLAAFTHDSRAALRSEQDSPRRLDKLKAEAQAGAGAGRPAPCCIGLARVAHTAAEILPR